MIDLDASPLRGAIMRDLQIRMQVLFDEEPHGPALLHKLNSLLVDVRAALRKQGIDFPVMACIILPSINTFELVRADLDHKAILSTMLNAMTKYRSEGLRLPELVGAIRQAFPDFHPHKHVPA